MNLRTRIANIIDPTHKNSSDILTGKEFLKYGSRPMYQDWSQLLMNEEDKYTGIMFAAINKRANLVTQLALEYLRTDAAPALMQKAKAAGETLEHPYLTKIDESLNFSNYDFWFNASTYIDLKGLAYVGVIRTVQGERVGDVMDFEMLNPYKTERITRNINGRIEVGGYREWLEGGYFRDWPVQQVIVIKRLNPFKPEDAFSMSDAGKDSQFTLNQAGDFTRHSLAANANAPGIYSTDVVLDDDLFKLFTARIQSNGKGQPIIANGAGAVKWQSTQIEMDKAALDKINQVSLEHLLAVSATSKTSLGIEQSGVTRDTAKVMRDQMTSDAGIPSLSFIIEAFNQDYKRYYQKEYKTNKYRIWIDSPLKTDREAEGKDIENRTKSADLYQTMVNKGYDRKIAAKYAAGEISLEDLGEPKNPPVVEPTVDPNADPKADPKQEPKPKEDKKNSLVLNAARAAEITSFEFPEVYESLGIDMDKLGFVMLDVEPFDVTSHVEDGEEDLFVSEDDGTFVKGAVAERSAHVTLMFGLMENANDWKKEIGMVLDGWGIKTVQVEEVGSFPSHGEDYVPIIAHVKLSDQLAEGNARLKLLPHIDTFPDYRPHITLAYVKNDPEVIRKWVNALGAEFNGTRFPVKPTINYGEKNALPTRTANALDSSQLASFQAGLQNSVTQVEEQVALSVIAKVANAYDQTKDVISDKDRQDRQRELFNALLVFYSLTVPLQAKAAMLDRTSEYGKGGTFTTDPIVVKAIDEAATAAAQSHLDTILEDLRATVKQTQVAEGDISRIAAAVEKKYPEVTAEQLRDSVREAAKGGKSDSEIAQALRSKYKDADFEELLKGVRQSALKGAEHDQLVKAIREEYQHITQTRAKVIARTETNRAFAMSQYQADRQFLEQNGWTDQAFKKWICRGPNPCVFCLAKQAEGPIPFGEPFARIGETVTATTTGEDGTVKVHAYPITYETVQSGDIHPNGHCGYELIIK